MELSTTGAVHISCCAEAEAARSRGFGNVDGHDVLQLSSSTESRVMHLHRIHFVFTCRHCIHHNQPAGFLIPVAGGLWALLLGPCFCSRGYRVTPKNALTVFKTNAVNRALTLRRDWKSGLTKEELLFLSHGLLPNSKTMVAGLPHGTQLVEFRQTGF